MRDSEEDDNISLSDLKPSSAQDSLLPPSQPRSSPDGEKRPREKKKTYEVWGVAFICLLAGMALGALFGERTAQRRQGGKGQGEYEGERVMMAPFGLNISVVFQPNRHFQMDGGVGIDKMWAEMMPLGRGFVQVDTEGKAIEYDGEKHGLEDTKVVAVFHQLHCLNNLRKSLFAAVDDYENFRYLAPSFKHEWKYCFDYLRQSLMCSADVTLEELEKSRDSDRKLASADGWGTRHVCRDFGRLFEWAERNRGSDDGGID